VVYSTDRLALVRTCSRRCEKFWQRRRAAIRLERKFGGVRTWNNACASSGTDVMTAFSHVLCPIDLSELSTRPLAYAAAVASSYGARLTVLHVAPTFDAMEVRSGALFDPVRIVYPIRREEILEQLRRMVTAADVPAAGVTLAAEQGQPASTIVAQAVATNADLLVIGTHGWSGFDQLLLGSIADKILRKAPCAVLTVPPHVPGSAKRVAVSSILCAVDFSPTSQETLTVAAEIAGRMHARLVVLSVIEWMAEELPDVFEVEQSATTLALRKHAERELRHLSAAHVPTVHDVTTRVVLGRAHRQIVKAAQEEEADLIVIGTRGFGRAAHALLGSTTEQVVRAASCPVLTVRGG